MMIWFEVEKDGVTSRWEYDIEGWANWLLAGGMTGLVIFFTYLMIA